MNSEKSLLVVLIISKGTTRKFVKQLCLTCLCVITKKKDFSIYSALRFNSISQKYPLKSGEKGDGDVKEWTYADPESTDIFVFGCERQKQGQTP